ncbi:hypothetical protein [Rhodovulum sp. YEN HP10]|uniref:hypothetical protein n=1 Tax=Rhodovulum sp. HP10 TaxID=3387397 RepID=UPI0039E17629
MTKIRGLAALLVLSTLNLTLMVPGGFVETRSFPGYGVPVLASFNVFLTLLGLGSLVLAYRVLRTGRVGIYPALAGAAFMAVYLLDLATIFPVAAAPMSTTLARMEWIGAFLGLALLALGGGLAVAQGKRQAGSARLPLGLLIAMGVAAVAIVTFATFSAM